MRSSNRASPIWTTLIPVLFAAIGCNSGDERLIDLSRQSADRQAEQNRLVETNNQQVIDATTKLVEADAQGRKENIELHRQIEAERSGVNQQRDALEQDRRQVADQRNRDPIIAEAILAAAGLIAAILPLAVCVNLLRGLFHKSDDEAMAEVLIQELVAQRPLLAEPERTLLTDNRDEPPIPPSTDATPSPPSALAS
jgi:hypothetical protein